MPKAKDKVSFLVFFCMWARLMHWTVPLLHVRICEWLEKTDAPVRVLMIFRGAAKSTIYAVYKAWKLYRNKDNVSLVWAADDKLATKLTKDTLNVLRRHPLTRGMLPPKPGAQAFSVIGAKDTRNASMEAVGVNGNATGGRANDIDFDDVEIPKNIKTPEARLNLRQKIEESTHIGVPGVQKTYIGTPHSHNSIYTEQIEGGAAVLKIPLFQHSYRSLTGDRAVYALTFDAGPDGYYLLLGIGKFSRLLVEGVDYRVEGRTIVMPKAPGAVLDIYAGNAWPERFVRSDIEQRRKDTRTLNAWDSQYQMEAKPVGETRLDPDRMREYDLLPVVRYINREAVMMLGQTRIVGACARWDVALGKLKADASALSLVLTDAGGSLYWQVAEGLTGDLDDQCRRVRALVMQYSIPAITVETNGAGGFVPARLRKHLAGQGEPGKMLPSVVCGVLEDHSTINKQRRILDAFEPPLSMRVLWCHSSVRDGPAYDQMKEFNPLSTTQPDDYIDSAAGAIADTPVRIGQIVGIPTEGQTHNWTNSAGVHELAFDSSD